MNISSLTDAGVFAMAALAAREDFRLESGMPAGVGKDGLNIHESDDNPAKRFQKYERMVDALDAVHKSEEDEGNKREIEESEESELSDKPDIDESTQSEEEQMEKDPDSASLARASKCQYTLEFLMEDYNRSHSFYLKPVAGVWCCVQPDCRARIAYHETEAVKESKKRQIVH